METIKSYTDISQSKTLSKILPHESADMLWEQHFNNEPIVTVKPWTTIGKSIGAHILPCWSLAALLEVISKPDLVQNSEGTWLVRSWVNDYPWSVGGYSNPVDACVAMIEKLHEQNIL